MMTMMTMMTTTKRSNTNFRSSSSISSKMRKRRRNRIRSGQDINNLIEQERDNDNDNIINNNNTRVPSLSDSRTLLPNKVELWKTKTRKHKLLKEKTLKELKEMFREERTNGKIVNELVKRMKKQRTSSSSSMTTNDSNNNNNNNDDDEDVMMIKEALDVLDVHNDALESARELVSSATLTTWALLLELDGNYKLASEKFAQASERDPKNFAVPHAFGMMEQRRGNYDRARKLLTKSLEIKERSTTYNALAILENRVGDRKRARKFYEKSIESSKEGKNTCSCYTNFAQFEMSSGNLDEAEKLFEAGWAILEDNNNKNNKNNPMNDSRSESVSLLTNWADLISKRILLASTTTSSSSINSSNNRENSSSGSTTSKSAREVFDERVCEKFRLAATLNPNRPETYTLWSLSERAFASRYLATNVSEMQREYDIIKEGIKHCPRESKLYLAEAMYLRRANRTEEALEKLEILSEKSFQGQSEAGKFDPHVWHALGMCKSDLFDFEGAIEAFERGSRARKDGFLNLPCITAEAHAEFINGNVGRARQLFILGRDQCIDYNKQQHYQRGQRNIPPSARASRRERSTHNRLWALLEKRAGTEDATRALFAAAVKEDRSDATAWMQWGQWEKRVQGPEIARDMFKNGLESGTTRLSGFLYQCWALLEQECGNDDVARELFCKGCKTCGNFAELWHGYAAFEANCGNVSRALEIVQEAESKLGSRVHEPLIYLASDLLRLNGNVAEAERKLNQLDSYTNRAVNPGKEVTF